MTKDNKKITIMVVDGDNALSIATILLSKGIDCEIVSAKDLQAIQEEEEKNRFPNLKDFNLPLINMHDVQEDCWWQQFDKKSKNKPRY